MEYARLELYIIEKLHNELKEDLYYHCTEHTIDVCESVERIAVEENVNEEDTLLLKTAALFHDSGFIFSYENHEDSSAQYGESILPDYGYNTEQISSIRGMILATKIPQRPNNLLEMIICDADLDYLGRDDFLYKSFLLKREWDIYLRKTTLNQWYTQQLNFLVGHDFFTETSKKNREANKQNLIMDMKSLLNL